METTSTQSDYVSSRDDCRDTAELKTQSLTQNVDPQSKDYKKELLTNFSDCMGKHGWAVTGPDKKGKEDNLIEMSAVPAPVAVAPIAPLAEDYRTKRAAECAYARQAQYNSSNARALARACELECQSQKQLAPDAPQPAACAP